MVKVVVPAKAERLNKIKKKQKSWKIDCFIGFLSQ